MSEQSGSARVYNDIDGNPCTLRALIQQEPEWAHSRITVMENELKEANQRIAELEAGMGVVVSGEPMEIAGCHIGKINPKEPGQ